MHDELVLEVPAKEAEAAKSLVCEEMEQVAQLRVPLVVDAAVGPTWFDAKA